MAQTFQTIQKKQPHGSGTKIFMQNTLFMLKTWLKFCYKCSYRTWRAICFHFNEKLTLQCTIPFNNHQNLDLWPKYGKSFRPRGSVSAWYTEGNMEKVTSNIECNKWFNILQWPQVCPLITIYPLLWSQIIFHPNRIHLVHLNLVAIQTINIKWISFNF